MLWGVLAGVALARFFSSPPVANAPPVPKFLGSIQQQQQQPLEVMEVQMPQYVAPQSSGNSMITGVALVAAGFLAGRQAMLFMGSGSSKPKAKPAARPKAKAAAKARPKSAIKTEDRPSNRGNPYGNQKNIQIQNSGFGNFVQKFQLASTPGSKKKSKYGMPIFLENGNINPAYLAAERKDLQAQSKKNTVAAEVKRKGLISKGQFELADYVRKKIGPVGSGADFYQSGR
jgi:hypothetical protein